MTDNQPEFLPFSRACIAPDAMEAVTDCLASGWLATGPRVQRFEEELAAYFQAPCALTVTSATAGLFLALKALDLQPEEEIITTPLTFVATLNTIVQAGGRPVLVDICPETRNLDMDQVAKAITPKTRAIMPVHFAGLAVDMDRLYDLAAQHGLRVIEDAAHAMGGRYKGKTIGSFGDIQVFSFHPCKNMTSGEGGCIVVRDEATTQRIKALRFHGIDRDAWNRFSEKGSQAYDITEPGYKYNMSDVQAAIGLSQLKILDAMNQKRRVMAKEYRRALASYAELTLPGAPEQDDDHAWHLFAVVVNDLSGKLNRHDLERLLKERRIGSGHHYPPVHFFRYYAKTYGWTPGDFPHAEHVGQNILSLPLFPDMTPHDMHRVLEALEQILRRS